MKKYNLIFISMLGLFSFFACEKENDKVFINDNPTSSVMAALPSFDGFLLENANNNLAFSWSATDFGFQAATTYTLQMDSATNNFSDPVDILITLDLTDTITVGDFNKTIIDAGYEEYDVPHSMQMRVQASVSLNADPVFSEVIDFVVTPYATEFPPIYMCGEATGGWDWSKGVEMRSSAPKVYQTIAHFLSGTNFRFFAQPDWGPTSYNYPWFAGGTVDAKLEDAGDGDNNFKFIGTTGYYDITCDLKTKAVTMTSVDEPKMFMTGGALGGWDWTTNYVQMTWASNGMFVDTTEFINSEAFRFFAQQDWGPTSYNYPYFSEGSVDALFEDAGDGDNNFRFIGATGNYIIQLNMLDKIITMTAE